MLNDRYPLASPYRRWVGFYRFLQDSLHDGDWDYVANPSGGFMGFWWHWRENKYLQLEQDKLCFKIMVEEESEQTEQWWQRHNALNALDGTHGLTIKKPVRRKGKFMTVAVLEGDYRIGGDGGLVLLAETIELLRKAEAVMNGALARE